MAEVILVVARHGEEAGRLLDAARRLGALTGEGRVRLLVLGPSSVPAADVAMQALAPGADIAAEVEARGSRADFLVVAQPADADDRACREAFRTALFRTERPLLVLPASGPADAFGERVAVAWRDDPQALKTLVPALRLLRHAKEVHLLAGVRAGKPAPSLPPVLVEHGVAATLQALAIGAAPFGETLLGRVRELGADMLVMGAFAHSPIREALLGGLTRYVLAHAELPVLMRY